MPSPLDPAPKLPRKHSAPPRGRVLCFAPHPDDEVIGPGGALRLHRLQGDPVRVVIATNGAAGDPGRLFDPATYAARRREESRRALDCLGIRDVVFWGFRDSCVITPGDLEQVAELAREQLRQVAPDVVYLPWSGESHSDHRALHAAVAAALAREAFRGMALGYEVWDALVPDAILDITPVAEDKRKAMLCYETQLAYVDYLHTVFGLNAHRSLHFNHGRGYSEAFATVEVGAAFAP